MFATNRRFSVRNGSVVNGSASPVQSPEVAVTSIRKQPSLPAQPKQESASLFGAGSLGSGLGGSSMSVMGSGPLSTTTLLSGLVPENEALLNLYYRDIYYNDAVAGSAVDMISTFPFSDFTLMGIDDKKVLDKYEESVARLNIRALMPQISTCYLVDGKFVGTLVFNQEEKVFYDIIIHSSDSCVVDELPLFSTDPIITVSSNQVLANFMNSSDPQAQMMRRMIGPKLADALRSSRFKLDPLSTLYLARNTLPNREPTSFLKRILPIYLVEKMLYRGTLVEAARRQRAMLHITMGDDTWEPTPQEMMSTVLQFQQADLDPLGAVVATRNGVQVAEVRQGGDFWKWTDSADMLTPLKLRAIGVSEAFLSGDSNYSNCLVADTFIPTTKGLLTIGSLGHGRQVNKHQDLDLTVMSRYGKAKTKHWLYNGFKETLIVETETGNTIQGTKNHPVLVLDQGEIKWKVIGDLKPSDVMCVQTQKCVSTKTLRLNVAPYKKREYATTNKRGDGRGLNPQSHRFVDVSLPKKMTPRLAYWLALFISEGSVSFTPNKVARMVSFGNTDKRLVTRFAEASADLFGIEVPEIFGSTADDLNGRRLGSSFKATKAFYTCRVPSFVLCDWLDKVGCSMLGRHNSQGVTPSYHKVVPWSVLQADEESQRAFLAAYFECDGSITEQGTTLFSKSEPLSVQVQALLNSHGYAAMRKQGSVFQVGLTREDAFDFWASAGKYLSAKKVPKSPGKYSKVNGVPAAYWVNLILEAKGAFDRHGQTYVVEGNTVKVSRHSNPWGFSTKEIRKFNYQHHKEGRYDNFLRILQDLSVEAYDKLVKALASNYRFTKVTSVTVGGKQHVYDISMASGVEPAFVANGLVVHNTETAMSVFMENMDAYRSFQTHKVFDTKVFPIIAVTNGFYRKDAKKPETNADKAKMLYKANNHTDLMIPTLRWHKTLKAKDESDQFAALDYMAEKGIPVPLRMIFAACKVDPNDLWQDLQQDKRIKERIAEITGTDVKEIAPGGDAGGDNVGGGDEFASLQSLTAQRKVPLLAREFGELGEVKGTTKTGKAKYLFDQRQANRDINQHIAKAVAKLSADPKLQNAIAFKVAKKLGGMPNLGLIPKRKG